MDNKDYTLLKDAYYGIGAFANGLGLEKHPRESQENYRGRQKLAYYLNYTGPIVNASVDPVFKDEINRDYNNTTLFTTFLDDCDRTGTDLQDFIRRNAVFAKLYGVVYLLVNNVSDLEESIGDNIKNRKLPYLVSIMPQDITEWAFDSQGKLILFTYRETITNSKGNSLVKYHRWDTRNWYIMNDTQEIEFRGEHNLGSIPIVQWFGRNSDNTNIKPPSEFLSIAHANYTLYQLCSWHTQILRDQTFSILTMPDIGEQDITIGTSNVLVYPPEATHSPTFIAPDAAPANVLTDHMERLINEMYRMSGVNSVIGVQESKSGVAKQWDFERTNQRLVDFAVQCENTEKHIVKLFELWTGESINYQCEYPKDFKINDVADSLNQAQLALDLGFDSKTYKVEVAKKVLGAYMPNIEPETFDDIVKELEDAQSQIDETYGVDKHGTNEAMGYQSDSEEISK